jgi:Spy/CpxP family protein refolding chaperone
MNLSYKSKAGLSVAAAAAGLIAAWTFGWAAEPTTPTASTQDKKSLHDSRHGHGRGDPMERMTRHLDLTDEQRTRIEAILSEARTEGEALRADLQPLREQLQSAVKAEVFSEDQVRTAAQSMAPVTVELMVLGAKTMHAVRNELTPEQRTRAEAMMGQFKGMGGRMGGWGRHRFFGPDTAF